jgi:hypothetical protein
VGMQIREIGGRLGRSGAQSQSLPWGRKEEGVEEAKEACGSRGSGWASRTIESVVWSLGHKKAGVGVVRKRALRRAGERERCWKAGRWAV